MVSPNHSSASFVYMIFCAYLIELCVQDRNTRAMTRLLRSCHQSIMLCFLLESKRYGDISRDRHTKAEVFSVDSPV